LTAAGLPDAPPSAGEASAHPHGPRRGRIAAHRLPLRNPYLSRAQPEERSQDQQASQFIDEIKRRGTGPYMLLQEGSTPEEAGFWY
jgi:hypothetical protein